MINYITECIQTHIKISPITDIYLNIWEYQSLLNELNAQAEYTDKQLNEVFNTCVKWHIVDYA